jgi:hypothetical protein
MRANNGYRAQVSKSSIAHKFTGINCRYRMLTIKALKISVMIKAVINKSHEYEKFFILNLSEH